MLGALFPVVCGGVFVGLLLQGFRRMRFDAASPMEAKMDRTGLRTVHPELLDAKGNVTDEELWAVRFQDLNENGLAPEAS